MNDIERIGGQRNCRLIPTSFFAPWLAAPQWATVGGAPLPRRKPVVRAFRPGLVPRDPWRGDDLPPRPAPRVPSHLKEPPLTERERAAYIVLAVIGLTPLVLLVIAVVLAHTPLFAN